MGKLSTGCYHICYQPQRQNPRKSLICKGFFVLAERVGFEPTVPCGTPDFESGTFGHSATSPRNLTFYQATSLLKPPM